MMFRKHVSKQLSAYCHDQLSPAEGRRIAEHLIGCASCRTELEEIKFGVTIAQHLPILTAPDSLWPAVDKAVRYDSPGGRIRRRVWVLSPQLALAGFAVLILVIGGLYLGFFRTDTSASWEVARLEGAPRIGSSTIDTNGNLHVGQWLETDANSRAKIDIANIGQAEIDPNTRVRLIETQPSQHRLELARGRLSARVWAPPKLFFVDTPSGVAEDLGCAYTLEVDDAGNSVLHVTIGWVSLELNNRESTVPSGAACATRRGTGPGTPYFEDASEAFQAALAKVDFADDQSKASAIKIVIDEARSRDAMTLWYLLARVNESDRGRVYARLAELAPPPAGVTRDGVLSLNQQMLDLWKEQLGFAPGANSPQLKMKKI